MTSDHNKSIASSKRKGIKYNLMDRGYYARNGDYIVLFKNESELTNFDLTYDKVIDSNIFAYLDERTLKSIYLTCKYARNICNDIPLWIKKIQIFCPGFPLIDSYKGRYRALYNKLIFDKFEDNIKWAIENNHPLAVESLVLNKIGLLESVDKRSIVNYLAEKNCLDVLKQVNKRYPKILPSSKGASKAAENNHVELLAWLIEHDIIPSQTSLDKASANGHLDVLKLVLRTTGLYPSRKGADAAAANGHLDVLAWLNNINTSMFVIRPSQDGIDKAAANGKTPVVKWAAIIDLYPRQEAINQAAVNGHLEFLQYAAGQGLYPMREVNKLIAGAGNIDVLEWLESLGRFVMDDEIINYVVAYPNENSMRMLKWIYSKWNTVGDGIRPSSIIQTIDSKYFGIVDWLIRYGNLNTFDIDCVNLIAEHGKLDLLELIVAKFNLYPNETGIANTIVKCHYHIIEWLTMNGVIIDEAVVDKLITMDEVTSLMWIKSNYELYEFSSRETNQAIKLERLDILDWLLECEYYPSQWIIDSTAILGNLSVLGCICHNYELKENNHLRSSSNNHGLLPSQATIDKLMIESGTISINQKVYDTFIWLVSEKGMYPSNEAIELNKEGVAYKWLIKYNNELQQTFTKNENKVDAYRRQLENDNKVDFHPRPVSNKVNNIKNEIKNDLSRRNQQYRSDESYRWEDESEFYKEKEVVSNTREWDYKMGCFKYEISENQEKKSYDDEPIESRSKPSEFDSNINKLYEKYQRFPGHPSKGPVSTERSKQKDKSVNNQEYLYSGKWTFQSDDFYVYSSDLLILTTHIAAYNMADLIKTIKGGSPLCTEDMKVKGGVRTHLRKTIDKGYTVVIFVDQHSDVNHLNQFSCDRMVHAVKLLNLPMIVLMSIEKNTEYAMPNTGMWTYLQTLVEVDIRNSYYTGSSDVDCKFAFNIGLTKSADKPSEQYQISSGQLVPIENKQNNERIQKTLSALENIKEIKSNWVLQDTHFYVYRTESLNFISNQKIAAYNMDLLITIRKGGNSLIVNDMIVAEGVNEHLRLTLNKGFAIIVFADANYLNLFSFEVMNHVTQLLKFPIMILLSKGQNQYKMPETGMWEYLQSQIDIDLSGSYYYYLAKSTISYKFAINTGISSYPVSDNHIFSTRSN